MMDIIFGSGLARLGGLNLTKQNICSNILEQADENIVRMSK